jgi:hypothetical protein
MLNLSKPFDEWAPLEVVEQNFYQLKLDNDLLVQAMEQLQAAGAGMVEVQHALTVENDIDPSSSALALASIDISLRDAYRRLAMMLSAHKERITALASYLALYDVTLASSMKELLASQPTEEESQ